ncbi:hypothetical protein ASG22_08290 [Chryseobacterium sp. Leaf405]|uniref:hypothetical protein n=1 Tax=Chryseobacterium sp. Leaf405 TaxID=1736367 RepID=UPI0006F4E822|nr:hypothetical protein [Chryseobacterium sp. Leaf405]KQT24013.1 hypothetical protein ASG22_08290 [Chryseobacterium sp. Leaf405]
MTFSEAVKRKRQFIKDSSDFTNALYHCLIIPANAEESKKYIEDFKKSPSSFINESCKRYTKDANFKVMIIPIVEFQHNITDELVNI